jgi:hypothetical protein
MSDDLSFWDGANNKICENCGHECEWEGTCTNCFNEGGLD